jgi:hypothetical protein
MSEAGNKALAAKATCRKLDLTKISPGLGDKFSPNLYEFLSMKKNREHKDWQVFQAKDGRPVLGWLFDGEVMGARLFEVLAYGKKAKQWCFTDDLKLDRDFWKHYEAIGRCAIDKHERAAWEERWDVGGLIPTDALGGIYKATKRTCRWCKRKEALRQWEEVVVRERWEEV